MEEYEVETEAEFDRAIAEIKMDLYPWVLDPIAFGDILPGEPEEIVARCLMDCGCCTKAETVAMIALKER